MKALTAHSNDRAVLSLPWGRKLTYTLVATVVFLFVLELALRAVGFRFQPAPLELRGRGPAESGTFQESATLLWKPVPNRSPFNPDGFVGPRIAKARTPGSFRIAVLGDSCTQWGDPPYSRILQQTLARPDRDRLRLAVERELDGLCAHNGHPRVSLAPFDFK